MKLKMIKGSRKREQKISLLKIAYNKKARAEQKITTVRKGMQQTYKKQPRFPEDALHSVEKQVGRSSTNAIQNSVNHRGCIICRTKYLNILHRNQQKQMKNRFQISNESLIYQNQQMNNFNQQQKHTTILSTRKTEPEISHYNQNNMQARLVNFKPSTAVVNSPAVCNDTFYQQKVKFYLKHVSKQHVDTHTMQTNWQNANQNYVQKSNTKYNIGHYNPYCPNYYNENNFVIFDPYLNFQGPTDSLTSSIESVESKMNDLITSQNVDKSLVTSHQFQTINDSDFYNFIH